MKTNKRGSVRTIPFSEAKALLGWEKTAQKEQFGEDRRCRCGAKLSRYNNTDTCTSCQRNENNRAWEDLKSRKNTADPWKTLVEFKKAKPVKPKLF